MNRIKIYVIIFIVLSFSFHAFSKQMMVDLKYAPLVPSSVNKGKIILKEVKDSRLKNEGLGDLTFLGNLRNNIGIPVVKIMASTGIDYTIGSMVYDALLNSGYQVTSETPDGISPTMIVEIEDCYLDGYVVYALAIKIKISLYSPDGSKLLCEKTFSTKAAAFEILPEITAAYNRSFNMLMKKASYFFNSNIFSESYAGRTYLPKENEVSYDKQKLKKIPSDMKNPENIQVLSFYNNSISKFENLDNLSNLDELDISLNSISKIENLDKLNKLKYLNLSSNGISKFQNFDSIPNLTDLFLSNNKITKFDNVDSIKKIYSLVLSYNKIKKIENLDQLSNLSWLNLSSNNLTKIENLDNLSSLQWLNLDGNSIKKIENLSNLNNLIYLDLSRNPISKIENLDKLTNLRSLNLSFCISIKKIENLNDLVNLRELDISNTVLKKMENLDNLTNLEKLNLSSSFISKLENIDTLVNLRDLNISGSMIRKLENLEKLPKLQHLIIGFSVTSISNESYQFLKDKGFKFNGMDLDAFLKTNFIKVDKAK